MPTETFIARINVNLRRVDLNIASNHKITVTLRGDETLTEGIARVLYSQNYTNRPVSVSYLDGCRYNVTYTPLKPAGA